MRNYEIAIRNLNEFSLNYKNQYPTKVPNLGLIVGIIKKEISESNH